MCDFWAAVLALFLSMNLDPQAVRRAVRGSTRGVMNAREPLGSSDGRGRIGVRIGAQAVGFVGRDE